MDGCVDVGCVLQIGRCRFLVCISVASAGRSRYPKIENVMLVVLISSFVPGQKDP